jgi:hypothetical protein
MVMDRVGKRYKNISGKSIQVPNRVSDAFCWSPGERIDIIAVMPSYEDPGYCVHNIDYVGNETCFERAWITEKILIESFIEIEK